MISRIDYFSAICEQYKSEILQNEDAELLLLPFIKGELAFSFIVPMALDRREYDLEISKAGAVIFSDFADVPKIGDESEEELEQLFRRELSASIKEFVEMDFIIENDEIVFQ